MVADPYLALDVELAAVFGDDPLEWANASSERSVAMKAVDRLLANGDPARTRDFSEALVYEVAGASVEVYSDRIALVPGKVDGYAFVVALLRARPAQIVRAVIAVLDGDVLPAASTDRRQEDSRVMDVETLARNLHDVAFAWNQNLKPWDEVDGEQRKWFRERAASFLGSKSVYTHEQLELAKAALRGLGLDQFNAQENK